LAARLGFGRRVRGNPGENSGRQGTGDVRAMPMSKGFA
jgi:hypothetical protein